MLSFSKTYNKALVASSKAKYSTKHNPKQKIIMLCGAPGVGKGTYARLLAEDFGYIKISTGDEIRKILHKDTLTTYTPAIQSELKRIVTSGKLVPDDLIMEILYQKINDPSASRGVILDGFPRTVSQLKMFTQVFPIHLVVNIEQNLEYMMASMLGRRTCMDCGVSYSAFSYYKDGYELDVMMPEKEGVCDHCGGSVQTRADDKEEVIVERLKEYENKTYPILEKLKKKDVLINFNAKRGIRDYPMLQQIVVSRVGLPYFYHGTQNMVGEHVGYYE